MPTAAHIEETHKDDGTTIQRFVVEFSNGSLKQLQELAKAFDLDENDPYGVIELAIGLLESLKEQAHTKTDSEKHER